MSDTQPLDIVVLAGGISHERDISLRSGRRVADALTGVGHSVRVLDPDAGLLAGLDARRPDVIWPVLHGASGEDGALLALLEATGIPTVGSRSAAAGLAWSKPTAKELVRRAGYATPRALRSPKRHSVTLEPRRFWSAWWVLWGPHSSSSRHRAAQPRESRSSMMHRFCHVRWLPPLPTLTPRSLRPR